jgi:hypothetical protein
MSPGGANFIEDHTPPKGAGNKKQMNKQIREQLLAPYFEDESIGGVRYFQELPLPVLEELLSHNFVDWGAWNDCPGVNAMFLPFLRRNPSFKAHGYACSWDRRDARVTVEGVAKYASLSKKEMADFAQTFNGADEMEVAENHARCWYD